jgi:arsenate reductase
MAEAIANQKYGDQIEAASAGTHPSGEVHELTLQTLEAQGLSTAALASKGWLSMTGRPFDLIVSVCDAAHDEPCPNFIGNPPRVHWNLADPPKDEHAEDMFLAVCDALEEAIGLLLFAPHPTLVGRGREAARQVARRFAPKAA